MRVLLIFCHPSEDSFGASLANAARETLVAGGHEVRFTDLYAEGFDPVLTRQRWLDYEDRERNRVGIETTWPIWNGPRQWSLSIRPGGMDCRQCSRGISTGCGSRM